MSTKAYEREHWLKASKPRCPHCGQAVTFQSFLSVVCPTASCSNFEKPKSEEVKTEPAEGSYLWACWFSQYHHRVEYQDDQLFWHEVDPRKHPGLARSLWRVCPAKP